MKATEDRQAEVEREQLLARLEKALNEVRTLTGLLAICSKCKRIRDDRGEWQQIEAYITARSNATFTHTLCPGCARELYPDVFGES